MGSNRKDKLIELQKAGVPMVPTSIDDNGKIHPLYKKDSVQQLDAAGLPEGYANFYRSDDVSATAYFYLDKPGSRLPPLQGLAIRTARLKK